MEWDRFSECPIFAETNSQKSSSQMLSPFSFKCKGPACAALNESKPDPDKQDLGHSKSDLAVLCGVTSPPDIRGCAFNSSWTERPKPYNKDIFCNYYYYFFFKKKCHIPKLVSARINN